MLCTVPVPVLYIQWYTVYASPNGDSSNKMLSVLIKYHLCDFPLRIRTVFSWLRHCSSVNTVSTMHQVVRYTDTLQYRYCISKRTAVHHTAATNLFVVHNFVRCTCKERSIVFNTKANISLLGFCHIYNASPRRHSPFDSSQNDASERCEDIC